MDTTIEPVNNNAKAAKLYFEEVLAPAQRALQRFSQTDDGRAVALWLRRLVMSSSIQRQGGYNLDPSTIFVAEGKRLAYLSILSNGLDAELTKEAPSV